MEIHKTLPAVTHANLSESSAQVGERGRNGRGKVDEEGGREKKVKEFSL